MAPTSSADTVVDRTLIKSKVAVVASLLGRKLPPGRLDEITDEIVAEPALAAKVATLNLGEERYRLALREVVLSLRAMRARR